MQSDRETLKVIKTEARTPEGRSPNSSTYSVHLTLTRSLTSFERDLINTGSLVRPLGIGGANPSTLPKTMLISDTTVEQVAAAKDEIKTFLALVESEGRTAENKAQAEVDRATDARDAEAERRRAIANSINWD